MQAETTWAYGTLPPKPAVRLDQLAGTAIVLLGLGGFIGWAATAPLASGAVASGTITVETSRKVVQHLEGGIIAELLVREGDRISAGQSLVRLDDIEARATHRMLLDHHAALLAQEARLIAERDGLDAMPVPEALQSRITEPQVIDALDGQRRIFESRRAILAGQVDIVEQRVAQYRSQIDALRAQLGAGADQNRFIDAEMADVQSLLAQGLERRPRLLGLQREAARLKGLQGDYRARIAQVEDAIAEAELELLNLRKARMEQAMVELREVQVRRAEVAERLQSAEARLGRHDISAPQAGRVLNLRYHTVGGVVPPGGPLLDIVPEDDTLVIEARVRPHDVEAVTIGATARVTLAGLPYRTTPRLLGAVTHVSADAVQDERTGVPYFVAKIGVPTEELERLGNAELRPGMPADVVIEASTRTVLDYLVQPLVESFHTAFREN